MPDAAAEASTVDYAGLNDPKAILGARFLAMLLQEVVLDVAVKAHSQATAERRRSPTSASASVTPGSRIAGSPARNTPSTNGSKSEESSLGPAGAAMDLDSPERSQGKHKAGSAAAEAGAADSSTAPAEANDAPEESVCAKCGKADCVGASGAVDCPDPTPAPSQLLAAPTTGTATTVATTTTTTTTTTFKPDLYSHNPLYECLVCSRQVAANRYAGHLANCLGIGTKAASSRKPANRGQKIANILESRRRATALVPGAEMFVSSLSGSASALAAGSGGAASGRAGTPGLSAAAAAAVRGIGGGSASRQSTPAASGLDRLGVGDEGGPASSSRGPSPADLVAGAK